MTPADIKYSDCIILPIFMIITLFVLSFWRCTFIILYGKDQKLCSLRYSFCVHTDLENEKRFIFVSTVPLNIKTINRHYKYKTITIIVSQTDVCFFAVVSSGSVCKAGWWRSEAGSWSVVLLVWLVQLLEKLWEWSDLQRETLQQPQVNSRNKKKDKTKSNERVPFTTN